MDIVDKKYQDTVIGVLAAMPTMEVRALFEKYIPLGTIYLTSVRNSRNPQHRLGVRLIFGCNELSFLLFLCYYLPYPVRQSFKRPDAIGFQLCLFEVDFFLFAIIPDTIISVTDNEIDIIPDVAVS